MSIIYFDSSIHAEDANIFAINRALTYGESIFTTVKLEKNIYFFLQDHLDRLEKSSDFLYGKEHFVQLRPKILEGLDKIKHHLNTIDKNSIRICIYDTKSPLSLMNNNPSLNFYIVAGQLVIFKKDFIDLYVSKNLRSIKDHPSFLKIGNYVESAIELKLAFREHCDDVLFLNFFENIAECTTSNVFFLKDNIVYTPKLNDGILDGITRKHIISCIKKLGFNLREESISFNQLNDFDSAFVTSSVRGIIPVRKLANHQFNYKNEIFDKIIGEYQKLS